MDNKMVPANEAFRLLMAELIVDKAIRDYREKELYREIDRALAQGDEAAFLLLTSELRSLQGIA
ncbi:IDEAL domain-containing protein [Paenibacillus antri]|uniref:IDEAL domain-containing protein n=1 Tax=Paenibacillus antri TaxID=2582848 RepID=A0A5R9GG40_9BACL|nr:MULTISPECIES: IDEAL domain-containing protein [Paenibacillus]TLS53110.1 IDEAL domain-containing protein [Paenibacillus antri]